MPTGVEYVDETWNPMSGCTKLSPGCKNCYAERMARRLAGRFGYLEAPRHFDVTLHPNRLDEPLRRRKPTRYLVCSMGDLFHKDVEITFLQEIFSMMQTCNNHTFLVLTKRPKKMTLFLEWWLAAYRIGEKGGLSIEQVLPNVWLGVTAENQAVADMRIPILLTIPAAKHWVSLEPMLGPIDVPPEFLVGTREWIYPCGYIDSLGEGHPPGCGDEACPVQCEPTPKDWHPSLDWVVLGGETGPGARPMPPEWASRVKDDCVAAGVPFYFKGWGAWIPIGEEPPDTDIQGDHGFLSMSGIVKGTRIEYVDSQGKLRDTNELSDFNLPNDWALMARVGKKAAGRLLDGREWNEIPDG